MVATKFTDAVSAPVTLLQSTEKNTRTSGLLVLTDPLFGEIFSHDALLVTVKVNGEGPPAPTSTKRVPNVTKGSMVIVGAGQPYP